MIAAENYGTRREVTVTAEMPEPCVICHGPVWAGMRVAYRIFRPGRDHQPEAFAVHVQAETLASCFNDDCESYAVPVHGVALAYAEVCTREGRWPKEIA